jgi:replicative DNA helicase
MINNLTLPHSIEAEELILGGILLDPTAIARVTCPVDAFYVAAHRKIFAAMLKLASQEQPTDLIHVADALGDAGLTAIGGMPKLLNIADRTISAGSIDRYSELVTSKWQRRKLITLCREVIDQCFDPLLEWDSLKKEAESKLTEAIAERTTQSGLTHISQILFEIYGELEAGENPATPTELRFFDQCLGGGFRGGELIVIAGRPSMGKTFVATYLTRVFAQQGPVALFSLEMDKKSIVRRIAAADAGLKQSWLTANAIPADKLDLFMQSYDRCAVLPIYVDDIPGDECSPQYIKSECHRIYREHQKLSMVVVDYLQLIGDQSSGNRVNELGRYTSALKSLSKKFDCPVVALSQLSRGVEARNDKRPVMSDIRSSGAIEQDADVVVTLYRDEYYSPDTPDQGLLELILAKNRHGKTVTAKAEFDPEIGTIKNYISCAL